MDLSTPLRIDSTIHCDRYRSIPHGVLSAILTVRRSTCSFKLICSSPGFALKHPRSRLPQFVPDPFLAPRPDPTNQRSRRVTFIGIYKTAVLREPITIFRTRVRSTLRTLEFWLSVRCKVNLHDVLNLSSVHHDVLSPSSILHDVLDLFP